MWKRRSCHDWWSETDWGASFLPPPFNSNTRQWRPQRQWSIGSHKRTHTTKTHEWSNKMNLEKWCWTEPNVCRMANLCGKNVQRRREWLMASNWITAFSADYYTWVHKKHAPRGWCECIVMRQAMWCGHAHSSSGHFPSRNMVGKGVDNITVNMASGLNLAGKWGRCVGSCLKRKRGA